jgi:hypothetical protein
MKGSFIHLTWMKEPFIVEVRVDGLLGLGQVSDEQVGVGDEFLDQLLVDAFPFQDATGNGVRELINERRLLEARRLLGGGRWDARTVAAHLGFTDPANFGRFFRDRTGLTWAAFAAREATPVTPPLPERRSPRSRPADPRGRGRR